MYNPEGNSVKYPEVKDALILIVDDNELCSTILQQALLGFGKSIIVHSGKEAIRFCELHVPDLIILDIDMPELNGWETCKILRQMYHMESCPIIFSSAKTTMEDELKCWDAGGTDYVPKPVNSRTLIKRIYSHVMLKLQTKELEKEALHDSLTGLFNRRYFDDYYNKQLDLALRESADLSLLLIDIDFFKRYNDYYGHQAGDECLRAVAKIIDLQLHRPTDIVARYGGEEFVVVLPATDLDGAKKIAQDISNSIESAMLEHLDSPNQKVTVSIGVSNLRRSINYEELFNTADRNLYLAKASGRNKVAA